MLIQRSPYNLLVAIALYDYALIKRDYFCKLVSVTCTLLDIEFVSKEVQEVDSEIRLAKKFSSFDKMPYLKHFRYSRLSWFTCVHSRVKLVLGRTSCKKTSLWTFLHNLMLANVEKEFWITPCQSRMFSFYSNLFEHAN